MQTMQQKESLYGSQRIQWLCYVSAEKNTILSKGSKKPIATLLKVFELCMDNFDGLCLDEKQPVLYQCLLTLYHENEKEPLIHTLEEHFSTISTLVETFRQQQDALQFQDVTLYYAILNFIDLLKTGKGNHMYLRLIS